MSKNFEGYCSVIEKDGADAIRFVAKRCVSLSNLLEETARDYEAKESIGAKIASLYLAHAQLENFFMFVSSKLAMNIGCLDTVNVIKKEVFFRPRVIRPESKVIE